MLKFIRNIILLILIIILLMLNFESSYKKDAFKVTINNYDLKCHYRELYQNAFLVKNGWEASNSVDRNINTIHLSNQIVLSNQIQLQIYLHYIFLYLQFFDLYILQQ